ncbi:MAG: AAA family ATPase, partial [Brevibacterium sp.]|nr:AAA family ATPase [Brevibacterium sp.]
MHLKSLTLRGFKSFASATTLRFEPGITCVVGPNGSGKSNVVDALSWVMGEQGAKNLRGGKMDDVIFAGTSKRQALGRAEVTLTIDNTDGAIPVDYTEVTISRTLFRTGGSEYAVNGTPARLLDIQELLNDSGLGKEMHVIVGQGRLDAILHADPIERRSFIEEAAGVLKHRRRKDKAVRKLTGLQTNLDRLSDLRTELNRQLGPLGRQAEAAQKAATVQATLRDSTARLLADDTVRLQSSLASTASAGGEDGGDRISDLEHRRSRTEERLQEIESRLGTLDSELEYLRTAESRTQTQIVRAKGIAQRAEDKRAHLLSEVASLGRRESKSPEELRSQAEHHREELGTAETAVEESAAALDRSQMRKEELALALKKADDEVKAAQLAITEAIKNRSALQSKSSQARERISDLTARIEANRTEIDTASARIAERREELATAEAAVEGVEAGESELDTEYESANEAATSLETELEGLRAQKAKTASELASAQARAEALSLGTALEADLEDILNADLPGVGSAVTERLSVATGFEMAVAAALSNTVSGVLVDSGQVALTVLDHLGEDTNVHLTIPAGAGSRGGAAGKSSAGKGANPTAETMAKSRALPTLTGSADGKSTVRWLTEVVSSDVPELTQLLNAALETVVCVDDAGSALSGLASHPPLTPGP